MVRPPLVTVQAHNVRLHLTTTATGGARILDTHDTAVAADGGGDLSLHGAGEHPGRARLDLAPGTDVLLDLHACTLTADPGSDLGRLEVLAAASTADLGRCQQLSVVASSSDLFVHLAGPRLVARLTLAGLSARLDGPERVSLAGSGATVTLDWATGARAEAHLTDNTTDSRIHHTETERG